MIFKGRRSAPTVIHGAIWSMKLTRHASVFVRRCELNSASET